MEPLEIIFDELGKMRLETEKNYTRVEIQSAHLGDRHRYTSTTVVLTKKQTEQIAIWLATALETLEGEK
jgi:hypothetical protein